MTNKSILQNKLIVLQTKCNIFADIYELGLPWIYRAIASSHSVNIIHIILDIFTFCRIKIH